MPATERDKALSFARWYAARLHKKPSVLNLSQCHIAMDAEIKSLVQDLINAKFKLGKVRKLPYFVVDGIKVIKLSDIESLGL